MNQSCNSFKKKKTSFKCMDAEYAPFPDVYSRYRPSRYGYGCTDNSERCGKLQKTPCLDSSSDEDDFKSKCVKIKKPTVYFNNSHKAEKLRQDVSSLSKEREQLQNQKARLAAELQSLKIKKMELEQNKKKEEKGEDSSDSSLDSPSANAKVIHENPQPSSSDDSCCGVCLENEKNVAFIPCGHLCCSICADKILQTSKDCHVCRGKIQGALKIFPS